MPFSSSTHVTALQLDVPLVVKLPDTEGEGTAWLCKGMAHAFDSAFV